MLLFATVAMPLCVRYVMAVIIVSRLGECNLHVSTRWVQRFRLGPCVRPREGAFNSSFDKSSHSRTFWRPDDVLVDAQ